MLETKEDVRIELINTAREVFSRFGFKKTTVDDIASAAGKGKSSLYYYFKNKEEIFNAVAELEASRLKERLKLAVNRGNNTHKKFKSFVLERMLSVKDLINYYSTLRNDYISNLEFIERARAKFEREEKKLLKEIVRSGIEEGIIKKDMNVNLTAREILAALKGLEFVLIDLEPKEMIFRVNRVIDIMLFGLIKR
jgi:AcrR family transcriptional regulator